ncbi:glycoside hydrolase family 2 [Phaeacidiphilus oryzae]|uniref:glycoside hydrolase family 2 n=1 Tax=Phaeacidiphilus oryzae TaxID=348818 RepID=UPI00055AD14A|nr:glycoside hydrolase family 2 [Phaeacidiphilus oryzae]
MSTRRHRRTLLRGLATAVPILLGGALLAPAAIAQAEAAAPAAVAARAASTAATSAATTAQGLRSDCYLSSNGTAMDFATYGGTTVQPSLNVADLVPALRECAGTTTNVAVHWTGLLDVPADGAYTFYIKGDNGFRMSLDGASVIDHWTTDWDVQTQSQPVTLTAGPHRLAFDYNQESGGASIQTEWSGPGIARQPVPDSALHLPDGYAPLMLPSTVDTTGRKAVVDLPGPVDSLPADLTKHVSVIAGDHRWSPTAALDPADRSKLVLTAAASDIPAAMKAKVRIGYDGLDGLATSAGPLDVFSSIAQNESTWYFATKWAKDVSPSNALPDYPRPQQTRRQWANLNGTWQFQATTQDAALPKSRLDGRILVPYPMEAPLSGVAEHHDWSLYQRTFQVPRSWRIGSGNRLHLNFGAVDYEAWVYVNGRPVAHHLGGYQAFTADITEAVKGRGTQTVLLKVKDTTGPSQATGKQSSDPSGIWYTSTSGIWQTVWMEPVPEESIDSLVLTPNLKDDSVAVTARPSAGTRASARVTATAYRDGRPIGSVTGAAGTALRLAVPHPELWSPDHPFLYDLKVTLNDGASHDSVGSYFGMRSISLAKVGGVEKIELNGKPTFLLANLDQGFWPDGIYTAPTDAALKSDLQADKELGFNTVRKHIKVEPARWYYWADRLGLMVWQDMPSRNAAPASAADDAEFDKEVHEIVDQHLSSPSIVMWNMMNEGWGEQSKEATGALADSVKAQDPSRLVDAHSGVNCCASHGDSGRGDVIDWHVYHGPANPQPDATRAAVDGEHGGYSLTVPGHIAGTAGGQDYGDGPGSIAEMTQAYVDNTSLLLPNAATTLSGSVFTQLSDVEGELNGLLTYDRAVMKVEPGPVRDINRKVIAAGAAAGGS